MVKIRLKRCGGKQRATYRIIVIDSRSRREGRAIREVGFYDPQEEQIRLDVLSLNFFLERGAKATETVRDMLRRAEVVKRIEIQTNKH
uniref:ribosomal protein S16 n=1 Tax=Anemia phyllitidis TaxID=12940 RepID=UPI0021AC2364|nr:ribosomal protein S16 [Anemia phyllitidis]UUL71053.1 ribosomal protein S16 [Anemia phyllitidis]